MLRITLSVLCSLCFTTAMPIRLVEGNSFVEHFDEGIEMVDREFLTKRWALKGEFNSEEDRYLPLDRVDTLSFQENSLLVNDRKVGLYRIQPQDSTLIITINQGRQPAFALYQINGNYHYRYQHDKVKKTLFLQPLDDWEADRLISVEGRKLRLEQVEQ